MSNIFENPLFADDLDFMDRVEELRKKAIEHCRDREAPEFLASLGLKENWLYRKFKHTYVMGYRDGAKDAY